MAYTWDVPSIVIPDDPNPEFDAANELKGEYPDEPLDPEKVAGATYPPEGRELVQEEARRTRDREREEGLGWNRNPDLNPNPDFNPVVPAPAYR
jgi:hypothetical protein